MKKIYIAPKIDVIILDTLCSGGFQSASVYQDSPNGKCIDRFGVVDEKRSKTEYEGLWGKSNSDKWGED